VSDPTIIAPTAAELWLFTQELEHVAVRAETLGHFVAGRWLRDYSLVISKQAQAAEKAEKAEAAVQSLLKLGEATNA
jgi:hypothetical protein